MKQPVLEKIMNLRIWFYSQANKHGTSGCAVGGCICPTAATNIINDLIFHQCVSELI